MGSTTTRVLVGRGTVAHILTPSEEGSGRTFCGLRNGRPHTADQIARLRRLALVVQGDCQRCTAAAARTQLAERHAAAELSAAPAVQPARVQRLDRAELGRQLGERGAAPVLPADDCAVGTGAEHGAHTFVTSDGYVSCAGFAEPAELSAPLVSWRELDSARMVCAELVCSLPATIMIMARGTDYTSACNAHALPAALQAAADHGAELEPTQRAELAELAPPADDVKAAALAELAELARHHDVSVPTLAELAQSADDVKATTYAELAELGRRDDVSVQTLAELARQHGVSVPTYADLAERARDRAAAQRRAVELADQGRARLTAAGDCVELSAEWAAELAAAADLLRKAVEYARDARRLQD